MRLYRASRVRRSAISLLVLAACSAGVVHLGFGPAGGVARGGLAVTTGSTVDAAVAAQAIAVRWSPSHGPEGGPALSLAVAPSAPETVYVGTKGGGVFRSTNGGRSWRTGGLDLRFPATLQGITSLAVDPRSPNTVYAGVNSRWDDGMTYSRPVYKTTNGGRTWRALGLKGNPVAISPAGPATVYAATGGARRESRLVKSTDGGRSWQPADRGLPSTYLWALAFDPIAPTTVYAAMGPRGILESRDGATSWRRVSISSAYKRVTTVTVDPRHARTVYAGTDAGVIESVDGGRSWRLLNAAMAGHDRDRGYGVVWALLVDPRDPRTVYASTRCAGVFKSTDGGRGWRSANVGLQPRCPWTYTLALDPRTPQTVYAADPERGVFKSLDGGAHWRVANTGLLGLSYTVSSLAVDPHRARTVYASAGPLGLFKSSDGGGRWQLLPSGLDEVDGVALDPGEPMNLLVGGLTDVFARIGRSTDGGRSWAGTGFGSRFQGPAVVALSGRTAYAGSGYGFGLFGSTDGGRSWRRVGPPGVVYVQALAIAPGNSAVAYVDIPCCAAAQGLYKTTDGGRSWQRLPSAPRPEHSDAIAVDPRDPATVYIGTEGKVSLFKSTDGGVDWQPASSGLTATSRVTALVIDPAHPATLYAASNAPGVFRSTDSGQSWRPLDAGPTVPDVTSLALDSTGRTLYAGTAGGGVVSIHPKA